VNTEKGYEKLVNDFLCIDLNNGLLPVILESNYRFFY
jgi:hypothetical protein